MITPVATIADALFAFIMSLLRDPEAAAAFTAAPHAALANNGLGDACAADVRAVKPVIVDHAHVSPKPTPTPQQFPPTDQHSVDPEPPDEVIREITRIINQFTSVDARTTIVDQSTNQNIWTEGGDVTQIFDQEAVVASGDDAVAAGDDANLIDSDVDITVGDVSVGNTTNDGSFNTTGADGDDALTTTDDAALTTADAPTESDDLSDAATIAGNAVATAVDAATSAAASAVEDVVPEAPVEAPAEAPAEAPVEQPADLLSADLTSADDTYEADAASAVIDEPLIEEPAEEQ